MSRITQFQSNFTLGEIDPLVHGRTDLQQYYSGLEIAKNIVIMPQGGFERRPGLQFLLDISSLANPNESGSFVVDEDGLSRTLSVRDGITLIPFEASNVSSFMIAIGHPSISTNSTNFKATFFANKLNLTNLNFNGSTSSAISSTSGSLNNCIHIVPTIRTGANSGSFTGVSNPIAKPWGGMQSLSYTQSGDSLILCHENIEPIILKRGVNDTTWTTQNISQATNFASPKHAFTLSLSNPSATLTPNAVSGATFVTAGSSVFTSSHVDQYINAESGFGRARIVRFESATKVHVITEIPFFDTNAIASGSWNLETGYEDVFSASRGYPRCATFHEGRLFFGGSYSLPNALFGSKVGDSFNFKSSEGLDDDAIFMVIESDGSNAITALRSGRDLQVFTTNAEYFIGQGDLDPITPSNIVIKGSTKRGSRNGVKPVGAEGGTLFIQRSGKAIREFLFSDVDLSYKADNISLLSSHLLIKPKQMALRVATSTDDGDLLFIVNENAPSTMMVVSLLRSQNVVAPSQFTTGNGSNPDSVSFGGSFASVGVDIDDVYTVVHRNINGCQKLYLELFDDDRTTDSAIQYYSNAQLPDQSLPSNTTAGGLTHLYGSGCGPAGAGHTVDVVRDSFVLSQKTVNSSGEITLDATPTTLVEIGIPYSVEVKTLPVEPNLQSGVVMSRKKRIVEAVPILNNTQNLTVQGFEIPFETTSALAGAIPTSFTGRKRVNPLMGYSETAQITLGMSTPVFATVLGLEWKLSTGQ